MNKTELSPDSFMYRTLKAKYPDIQKIYTQYDSGSYYNRAFTSYYDEKGNVIYSVQHGYYG